MVQTMMSLVALFLGGGRSFSPSTAAGDDHMARFFILFYSIIAIFVLANLFISTLNDLFCSADQRIAEERKLQKLDPVDVILNRLSNILSKGPKKGSQEEGKPDKT